MTFYLASGNPHKVAELQSLAEGVARAARQDPPARRPPAVPAIQIRSAVDVGGMPAVVEDAGTFAGNARKKALALRERVPPGAWALADDSGLCVDALDGAPGVESAYYAGPHGDGVANLAKLVAAMHEIPGDRRGAQFRCVLCAIGPDGEERIFEGVCAGRLLAGPRGAAGFGYDPLFVPEGYEESFAELGESVKGTLSHRARAWAKLVQWVSMGGPTPR